MLLMLYPLMVQARLNNWINQQWFTIRELM